MKHFIGGSAVGFMVALWTIPNNKRATEMSNSECLLFVGCHFFMAGIFGLASWGLLP